MAGLQTIAEVCFHMIANDRRTFCGLRSTIRDRLRSLETSLYRLCHLLTTTTQLGEILTVRLIYFSLFLFRFSLTFDFFEKSDTFTGIKIRRTLAKTSG